MINILAHDGDWHHTVNGATYTVSFYRDWPGPFVAEISGHIPSDSRGDYTRVVGVTSIWGMPFVRFKAWRELKKMVKEFS